MKSRYPFISVLFICCFAFQQYANAQLTIVPGSSAAALAAKLTGPGVIVISPTLTCPPANGRGIFSGISTLSFDSGIVLSSGSVLSAANPASVFASTGYGTAGDAQLTALSGNPTNDACVLEFDFRPAGDTVKFDYVFGSEEYNGYTCSSFNDVFGFFISGPGFAGATNIALVPGTTIPVCINSVNCSTGGPCTALVGPGSPYCSYYVNNMTGTTVAYDGLTTTLTAIAHVTPCDTYHLKIGIADCTDDIYDSGVFLKAGSLTSTGIHISPLGVNPLDTGYGSQYCVRGCVPGKFVFARTGSLVNPFTIHYIIGGTAINGYDYTFIPDSVVIPPLAASATVFINGLIVPPAGPKTVVLQMLAPYTCGGVPVIVDSAALTIYDSFYVHINTSDTSICLGQSVFINTSGGTNLDYSWSPSASLSSSTLISPTATPTVTTTYVVSAVFPSAGCAPSTDQITITVYPRPTLNVGAPIQNTCLGIPLQLNVTATPTASYYTYGWIPATYLNDASLANPIVTPGVTGDAEYYVTVTTPVPGCSTTDSFLLHVLPNDFTLVNQDTGICFPSASYLMFIIGDPEFTYHWTPTVGVSDPSIMDPTITPPGSIKYTVTGSYPGCPDMVHTLAYSIENPTVNIITTDTTICIGYPIAIPVVTAPVDSPYTLLWEGSTANLTDPTVANTSFFSSLPGTYTLYLTITSSLGCNSKDSVTFHTAPPIHIGLTPGNTVIPFGGHLQLNAVNLTDYPLFYYWSPNDGSIDNPNLNNPIVAPLDSTTYTVLAMNQWGCTDSAKVTIGVDFTVNTCIPTAFTPNGDGLNDVFKLCDLKYKKLVDFRIFNRWGQVVYTNTNDATKGWDGTFNGEKQDMGTYNYVIILATPDGGLKSYKGDVTLIR